jgi:hypothetical protein
MLRIRTPRSSNVAIEEINPHEAPEGRKTSGALYKYAPKSSSGWRSVAVQYLAKGSKLPIASNESMQF